MKTVKIYVENTNYDKETETFMSVRVPVPTIVTVVVSNIEQFCGTFSDKIEQDMVVQGLHECVIAEFRKDKTFPMQAWSAYKQTGDAIFEFHHLEIDEWGEKYFVYYDFVTTAS